jgi:hypothetical protein
MMLSYCSQNIVIRWMMRWEGNMACTGERQDAYRLLGGNSERKGLLARSRPRWKYSIKMGIKDMDWEGVDYLTGSG